MTYEPVFRLACFAAVFTVVAIAEALLPRRPDSRRRRRWGPNLFLALLNTFAVRVVWPLGAVGVAVLAEQNGWGLLRFFGVPHVVAAVVSVLLLDLAIYGQHRVLHAVPLLWRLHRVHHTDRVFDVTTGLRFHPLEIVPSMLFKAAVVVALGPPPVGVLAFEALLNATSLFSHANLRLPAWLDRGLRWVVVTPDMHRVHHSTDAVECGRNFGFNLPWWDYLFGTYASAPAAGHEAMTVGVPGSRAETVPEMLVLPFRGGEPPQ